MTTLRGYIYVVKTDNNLYKIGSAGNVEQRIRKMPFRVHLVHIISTDNVYDTEMDLQERFRKSRLGGEWFRLTETQVQELKSIKYFSVPSKYRHKSGINIRFLPAEIVEGLNRHAFELGFGSRERFLQEVLRVIANSPSEIVEQLIENSQECGVQN
jgi:hypothetical protein